MANEQTLVFGKDANSQNAKKEKVNSIFAKLGIGIASAGAGAGAAMFLTSAATPNDPAHHEEKQYAKPEVAEHPKEATTVKDSMDFNHAFSSARHEIGANGFFVWHGKVFGTSYAEEQNKLSPDEKKIMYGHIMEQYKSNHHIQQETAKTGEEANHNNNLHAANVVHPVAVHPVIVHDEAPHATSITNDMSFKDAFAVARAQVGPGGIFDWHGKHYNTYTREELNEMSHSQKNDFMASVGKFEIHNMNPVDHNTTVSGHDIDIVKIDHGISTEHAHAEPETNAHGNEQSASDETIITDKIVHLDDGSTARVQLAEVNGHPIMKIDIENDGKFDMDISRNDDGTFHLQAGNDAMDVTKEEFDHLFHIDDHSYQNDIAGTTDAHLNDNINDDHHNFDNHLM